MPVAERSTPGGVVDKIVDYYEQTWFDYRTVWVDDDNQAFHFGYWDPSVNSHSEALLNSNRILAKLAQITPGERVLDAGCAHGGSATWLAENKGVDVVGITLVDRQVTQARQAAERRGLSDKVSFEVADFCDTGMESGSFDVVWALESLCHAPHKIEFYKEAARLLKPGGRLVVADYMRARRPLSPRLERTCKEWLQGWAIEDIDTPEEHTSNALSAGFEGVVVRDRTAWTRRSLRRLHRLSLVVWYPDLALSKLGVRSQTQRGNVVASRRQWQALRAQAWHYGVLTATKPAQP